MVKTEGSQFRVLGFKDKRTPGGCVLREVFYVPEWFQEEYGPEANPVLPLAHLSPPHKQRSIDRKELQIKKKE